MIFSKINLQLRLCLLVSALFFTFLTSADVSLPHLLSSNMVLQRNAETAIWGWADKGEKVTVTFRGKSFSTETSSEGKWMVKVPVGKAGGPFELIIKGSNKIVLDNILAGDVWVCSGQSNMEWPLSQTDGASQEIQRAQYPAIRLFHVEKNAAVEPAYDTAPAQWQICSPQTVATFSAVGYYFGKNIHLETGVPIGLISSNWGGTIIETWISPKTVAADSFMNRWATGLKDVDVEKMAREQKEVFESYQKELNKVQKTDFHHPYIDVDFDDQQWYEYPQPELWENHDDFVNFDGIVWYRKSFKLPAGFKLQNAEISLAQIDDSDVVWINGKRVGETYNQYNMLRTYKVPAAFLHEGKNQITVRVEDYTGGGGFHGDAGKMYISDGTNSIALSGKWKMMKDEIRVPQNPVSISQSVLQPNQFPTLLFNGMIHPLLNFAVKGAIWYQGESNADSKVQALRYENQMRMLIADWREQWGNSGLSFYMVQLANYKAENSTPGNDVWPFLREAQAHVATDEKVEMACIIDIGEAGDIHPRNKKDVGYRLALNPLNIDYGKDVVYNGPRYKSVEFDEDKAIITFEMQGAEFEVKNKYGYINGFVVASNDGVFHYAKARLSGKNKVEVYSNKIKEIAAVRYLWDDNPGEVNLYNRKGLPAEPFRTDKW
ncbi:MAG: beta galactosidase jelly roll domain-containing protein [Prolixibacteraceae bacterium]|jgi:sialate O-acetylesterase|nr:beta galactosidase jelly roll domain-containing protein [Prolixibacteraceae bacterium]